ncbi:MAG TPA: OsmC family protein, partial [Pyrinomonadaceae bacterium]|jgi:osmotically inducible protein OsmC|nr:OsmC family protein [Pyrinomonadaceae bacterium]
MMLTRTASAVWEGNLKDGQGRIKVESGTLDGPYTFSSRFETAAGTNPEELLGAAHAGCFSMALSLGLVKAGFTPERINTTATVHLDKGSDAYRITSIDLDSEAQVPGINRHQFLEQVELAKTNCVVSEALRGTEIRLQARLEQAMR